MLGMARVILPDDSEVTQMLITAHKVKGLLRIARIEAAPPAAISDAAEIAIDMHIAIEPADSWVTLPNVRYKRRILYGLQSVAISQSYGLL